MYHEVREVIFIAKTNLNSDGRILNEISLLKRFGENIHLDFILLPDQPTQIDLYPFVKLYEINLFIRHHVILRPVAVIAFTLKSLILMLRLKPDLVHVQDSAVVLPALLFSFLRPDVPLIYDDHEIPNENEGFGKRSLNRLELNLMRRANYIIHANQERLELMNSKYKIKTPSTFFLNLPYFDNEAVKMNDASKENLGLIDESLKQGVKFIMHQGVITKQRGREILGTFASQLSDGYKILLLGGSEIDFERFIEETGTSSEKFFFVGNVHYSELPFFWKKVIASIIIYLPTYMNNRLCAPNRFYLSVHTGVPVIVNKSNPVLKNFVEKYNCGYFIEDVTNDNLEKISLKFQSNDLKNTFEAVKYGQMKQFNMVYSSLLNFIVI